MSNYQELIVKVVELTEQLKGGKGSGNHGHGGRPGKRGGSAPKGGGGGLQPSPPPGSSSKKKIESKQPSWLNYEKDPSVVRAMLEKLKTGGVEDLYFRGSVLAEVSSQFEKDYEELDLTTADIPKDEGREFIKGNKMIGIYYEPEEDYTGITISNLKPKKKTKPKPVVTRPEYD